MSTRVVWFSYKMDALPLLESLACARQTFPAGTTFHVFDQDSAPLDDGTISKLENGGAIYSQTSFERNGNLNGITSVRGEIECFLSAVKDEDDILWKMDCDTLALRPWEVILRHYERDGNLLGCGLRMPCHGYGWWGPSYTYRAAVLPVMQEHFQTLPALKNPCEDIAMSTWLLAANRKRAKTLPTKETGGPWSNYNWTTQLSLEEYARRFGIVTFGSRYQIKELSPAQQREWQADHMRAMRLLAVKG